MMRIMAAMVLAALAFGASADWDGQVVGVSDGDTLTALHDGKAERVRLDEIDAPESSQAYGQASKKSLSDLCFGKFAAIKEQGTDKYGRTLGRVFCDGMEVNTEQVRRGLAWFYTQYSHDPMLQAEEVTARAAKIGLWADAAPMPPWEYRHGDKAKARAGKEAQRGHPTLSSGSGSYQWGPRGGCFTYSANGKKRYVPHENCR